MSTIDEMSIPCIREKGHEGFYEWLAAGLRHFRVLRNGGPPGPVLTDGDEEPFSHAEKASVAPMKLIPGSEDREQRRGEACPPGRAAGEAGGHHPSVTP